MGLKPPSPLRARNGHFGAVFGRRGDAGFIGPLFWACSGVVGFNVAMFLSPARDVCRPTWPGGVCVSVKQFAPQTQNWQKMLFSGALGEFFRGNAAGGGAPGEFLRGPAVVGSHRASFDATRSRQMGPAGSVNTSMRSYTHLIVSGRGRPLLSSPQRKALTKGERLPVKAVTSLDNGRKWRVYAGRTLELLR